MNYDLEFDIKKQAKKYKIRLSNELCKMAGMIGDGVFTSDGWERHKKVRIINGQYFLTIAPHPRDDGSGAGFVGFSHFFDENSAVFINLDNVEDKPRVGGIIRFGNDFYSIKQIENDEIIGDGSKFSIMCFYGFTSKDLDENGKVPMDEIVFDTRDMSLNLNALYKNGSKYLLPFIEEIRKNQGHTR